MENLYFAAYDQSVFEGIVTMVDSKEHTIIGVDDDFRIRESIESLIKSAGFASVVFPSAEEFLRSGRLVDASCLITDIRMPRMDGIELQHRVRLDRPELPLIFVSGHFDDETRCKAITGGAFALIDKPFDPGDLLKTVNQAISMGPHC